MIGVILINFGGPKKEEEVFPFLKNIFKDVLPAPVKFLAPLLALLRKNRSKKMYAAIGGISPVVEWTVKQAEALEKKLGSGFKVYVGMKYSAPHKDDAVLTAKKDSTERIIPIDLTDCPIDWSIPTVDVIKGAIAEWKDVPRPDIHILFSAHAMPRTNRGRAYENKIYEYVEKAAEHFTGVNIHLGFQSGYGPFWSKPATKSIICRLKHRRTYAPTHLLIIPLGFSCENLETLYEIDKVYIPYAKSLGIENIKRASAINNNPLFIDLLAELVLTE